MKPYLKHPVKGDVIPPYIYDGSDWILLNSEEAKILEAKMIKEYRERFNKNDI